MCSGLLTFSFLIFTATLKGEIFILILGMRELKLIEFKLNGSRTYSSLVNNVRFGHISLSGSPDIIDYIPLILKKYGFEMY